MDMTMVTEAEQDLYEILTANFDNEGGYQTDQRGGISLRYISGEQCISRLNRAFGPLGWTFEIRERWFDEAADECVVMGRLTAFRKVTLLDTVMDADGTDRAPYREVLQPIYHEQMGSQKHNRRKTVILSQQAFDNLDRRPGWAAPEYTYTQQADGTWRKNDSAEILDTGFDWKGAATDSLKKCASLFGIALELSRKAPARGSQQPRTPANRPQPPQGQDAQNRPPQPAPARPATKAPEFKPPFESQKVTEELACRAAHCGVVLEPGAEYEVEVNGKKVAQTTEYIVKRSKEEAFGAVLCLTHVMAWIQAKREQGISLASDPAKSGAAA
jgi:hypothetical protein